MSSEKTRPSTNRRLLFQGLAVIGVAAIGYGGYRYASRIVKQDPLAKYREKQAGELPDTVAIQSQDSTFNHYDEGNPKASCKVKSMQVAQNRQVYTFQGITDGQLLWKKASYGFAANAGNWNGFSKKLMLNGNLRLTGSKFDLKSDQFTYDEVQRTFVVPGNVDGNLYGGKVQAINFTYNIDKESFRMGKSEWKGVPPKEFGEEAPVQGTKTVWDYKADDTVKNGDIMTFTNARVTDGEIILKAPKVERNVKTDVLTATGRVYYFGTKANLIADKVVVYRKEKRAVLTGNVTMLVKPKEKESEPATEVELTPLPPAVPESISSTRPPAPDDDLSKKKEDEVRSMKNLRQYPMAIAASSIEYWYKKGDRHAKITGSPQARQEMADNGWRYVWSHHANYDGEKELLFMFSKEETKGLREVILKNSVGDEFYGNSGIISTKEDDDTYSFKDGSGKTSSDDDELPRDDKKKGGATGGGTAGGTGGDKGKGGGGGNISGPIGRHKT